MQSPTHCRSIHLSSSAFDSQHSQYLISCPALNVQLSIRWVYQRETVLSCLPVNAAQMTDDVRQICSCLQASANCFSLYTKKQETFQGRETAVCLWKGCGILITSKMIPEILLLPSARTELCYIRVAFLVLISVCVHVYLLHRCIATNQLLPQVSDVMVEPLHVFLKVLPEGQERLLHLTLKLLKTTQWFRIKQQNIMKVITKWSSPSWEPHVFVPI